MRNGAERPRFGRVEWSVVITMSIVLAIVGAGFLWLLWALGL
jgi:hypothetical protein